MLVRAIDVVNLRKFEYPQLPESSRRAARDEVLDQEVKAVACSISSLRSQAIQNIHASVNNPNRIAGVLRHKRMILRLMGDVSHFEKFIESNVCHFLKNGAYVTYLLR